MGFVTNFIRFQQCKNFENRLRCDKVTESLKVGTFFETQCIYIYIVCVSLLTSQVYYNFVVQNYTTDNTTDSKTKILGLYYTVQIYKKQT